MRLPAEGALPRSAGLLVRREFMILARARRQLREITCLTEQRELERLYKRRAFRGNSDKS
jgi:hypothetical protein